MPQRLTLHAGFHCGGGVLHVVRLERPHLARIKLDLDSPEMVPRAKYAPEAKLLAHSAITNDALINFKTVYIGFEASGCMLPVMMVMMAVWSRRRTTRWPRRRTVGWPWRRTVGWPWRQTGTAVWPRRPISA